MNQPDMVSSNKRKPPSRWMSYPTTRFSLECQQLRQRIYMNRNNCEPMHQSYEPPSLKMRGIPSSWRSSPALRLLSETSTVDQRKCSTANALSQESVMLFQAYKQHLSNLCTCSEIGQADLYRWLSMSALPVTLPSHGRRKSFGDVTHASPSKHSASAELISQEEILNNTHRSDLARWKSFHPSSQARPPTRRPSIRCSKDVLNLQPPLITYPFTTLGALDDHDLSGRLDGSGLARWKGSTSTLPLPARPERRSSFTSDQELQDQSGRSNLTCYTTSSRNTCNSFQQLQTRPSVGLYVTDDISSPSGINEAVARWKNSEGLNPLPICPPRRKSKGGLEKSDGPNVSILDASGSIKRDSSSLRRTASVREDKPHRSSSNTLAEMQLSLTNKSLMPRQSSRDSQELLVRTARFRLARTLSEQAPRRKAPVRTLSERVTRRVASAKIVSGIFTPSHNAFPSMQSDVGCDIWLCGTPFATCLAENESDDDSTSASGFSEPSHQSSADRSRQSSLSLLSNLKHSSTASLLSVDSNASEPLQPASNFNSARCA